jgi:hypothetical protein
VKTGPNPAPIPFSITPDAKAYLLGLLKGFSPKNRLVLLLATSQSDGLNPPRWSYDGESFVIGDFDISEKPETECIESELLGRRVMIASDALKRLSGQLLGLREVVSSRGIFGIKNLILVAEPDPNPANLRSVAAREELWRRLYIGAMTVLGGFTGMGVIWIASSLVAVMLNISYERLLTHVMPVLIVGWVAGAIISFCVFKSLLKTKGRTKMAQRQIQRKYFGSGGLDADVAWWTFLGIPVPLTAGLILAIEPYARTNEQKSGFAVAALVLVFGVAMFIGDRLPRRLVLRLGILGWVLTLVLGFWFFKTHGP